MFRRLIFAAVMMGVGSLALTGSAAASFDIQSFGISADEAPPLGSPLGTVGPAAVQAGSHPFAFTTSFKFNRKPGTFGEREPIPDGDVKDVEVELPPGFVGNPTATPKCTFKQFNTTNPNPIFFSLNGADCPNGTQVGVIQVEITPALNSNAVPLTLGIYNLVAPPGVPAEFGANPIGIPIIFTPTVRTGGDYGLTVSSKETNQGQRILGANAIFWGIPADSSHNGFRGECLGLVGEEAGSTCAVETPRKPFLRLPTSCPVNAADESLPFSAKIHADSWQNPSEWVEREASNESEGHPVGITGCEHLDFSPTISVQPDTVAAASPTGLSVRLHSPQNENPDGLGEADLRKAVVALPEGFSVSPSAANGLGACSEAEIALHSSGPADCPDASKVGSAEIVTPLLEAPLTGSVYVATPYANPSKGLLELYVVAEGSGVLIKLAGEVHADPVTGRLTSTFDETPQDPFSELKLNVFGGPRAALMTPAVCGAYQTTGVLAPWSGTTPVAFQTQPSAINTNCGGGFSPSFSAGTVSNQAGGFSPFTFRLTRSDTDQDFKSLALSMPPGLLGMLSHVVLCGEPQAAQGTCPASSQIGHVSVGAGPGPDQVFVPQPGKPQDPVFLTGPYGGQPFGLSIVVPAEAGPFNLGTVVVRSAIGVDPHTAQITIVSDAFPTILQGIPLHVKTIDVTVDRAGFIFNPTNCNPLTLNATVASTQNATSALTGPFQAVNCANLPFHPKFTASTRAKTSKANGASLTVKVSSGPGQANIGKVDLQLPKLLPSRLSTLQKACTEAQFNTNPAGCPAASMIGVAKAITPVLNVPLVGPAILVSHGGAAFPDVEFILQGQGVTIDLDGKTQIKKGITYSRFETVPDAPITSFETVLPQGPHSVLAANLPVKAKGSLCGSKLALPTTLVGQNGAVVKQSTKLGVSGCPRVKRAHRKAKTVKSSRRGRQ